VISEWGFKIESEIKGRPDETFLEMLDRFYLENSMIFENTCKWPSCKKKFTTNRLFEDTFYCCRMHRFFNWVKELNIIRW